MEVDKSHSHGSQGFGDWHRCLWRNKEKTTRVVQVGTWSGWVRISRNPIVSIVGDNFKPHQTLPLISPSPYHFPVLFWVGWWGLRSQLCRACRNWLNSSSQRCRKVSKLNSSFPHSRGPPWGSPSPGPSGQSCRRAPSFRQHKSLVWWGGRCMIWYGPKKGFVWWHHCGNFLKSGQIFEENLPCHQSLCSYVHGLNSGFCTARAVSFILALCEGLSA